MIISPDNQRSIFGAFMFIMGIGLPISYISTMIIGVPIYQLLKRNNLLSMRYLIGSGAIAGALALLLFFFSISAPSSLNLREIIQITVMGLAMGSSIAFAFGKLAGVKGDNEAALSR